MKIFKYAYVYLKNLQINTSSNKHVTVDTNTNTTTSLTDQMKVYHKEGQYRFIYANIDGYSTIDGGKNGGYLIQAIKHIFENVNEVIKSNLNDIILQINKQAQYLSGTKVLVQQIEDVNRLNDNVQIRPKEF